MKTKLVLSLILGLTTLSACTNKQIFNSVKSNAKSRCEHEPNQKTRTDCLNEANQDYQDYKRERERLLNTDET